MTNVDQFESVFRAAAKVRFSIDRPRVRQVLAVTDLDAEATAQFQARVRAFLSVLGDDVEWTSLDAAGYTNVADLLSRVEQRAPDLVCTFRHLKSDAWQWPYGLGEHVDVLTQVADVPVMVLPHPERGGALPHAIQNTDRILTVTDHLTGDDRLVNWSLAFTEPRGTLWLAHVEDLRTFERVVEAISRIPDLDTETAREQLRARLLKDPTDYIASCREAIAAEMPHLTIEEVVVLGHRLVEYQRLVDTHALDLLVMNTKDESQSAMQELAYALAVEVRSIPLLLL